MGATFVSGFVVDISAIVALLLEEPKATAIREYLATHANGVLSAGALLELRIVCLRRISRVEFEEVPTFLRSLGITIVPVTEAQANLAADAYARFGKGQGHPAQLNFGDCFSYALAHERGLPLLFVGDDFARSDLTPALGSEDG